MVTVDAEYDSQQGIDGDGMASSVGEKWKTASRNCKEAEIVQQTSYHLDSQNHGTAISGHFAQLVFLFMDHEVQIKEE